MRLSYAATIVLASCVAVGTSCGDDDGGDDTPVPTASRTSETEETQAGKATIIIHKTTGDDSPGEFSFRIEAVGEDSRQITVTAGSEQAVSLRPATYRIVEADAPGFELDDAYCSQADSAEQRISPEEVIVEEGAEIHCYFVNQANGPTVTSGQILIENHVEPENSGQAFAFSVSYGSVPVSLGGGATHNSPPLAPGTYSVQMTPVPGWETTASCDDGSDPSSVGLSEGEIVICSFTSKQYGQIVVAKEPLTGVTYAFTFNGSFQQDPFKLVGGTSHTSKALAEGSYSLSEKLPVGWTTTGLCSDGSAVSAIELSAGEIVTCTFTNAKTGALEEEATHFHPSDAASCSATLSANGEVKSLGEGEKVAGGFMWKWSIPAFAPNGAGPPDVTCSP